MNSDNQHKQAYLLLLFHPQHLKEAKTALENGGLLDKKPLIGPYSAFRDEYPETELVAAPGRLDTALLKAVKTARALASTEIERARGEPVAAALSRLSIPAAVCDRASAAAVLYLDPAPAGAGRSENRLVRSLGRFLRALPARALEDGRVPGAELPLPTHYTLYPPRLLLLQQNAFDDPAWQRLFGALSQAQQTSMFEEVAAEFGVSHIAIPGTIPVDMSEYEAVPARRPSEGSSLARVLRLPTEIRPLLGDFGPTDEHTVVSRVADSVASALPDRLRQDLPDITHPLHTQSITKTLFVTVVQFGISLVFPPLRCMFSRGNVKERERLLRALGAGPHLSLTQPARAPPPPACTAVDLFAGIGYFSFCYAASHRSSGVRVVATWEINGWSVEAMFRGAAANGWPARLSCLAGQDQDGFAPTCSRKARGADRRPDDAPPPQFYIHHGPHQTAGPIVRRFRQAAEWPPVRHVNLGYLPFSSVGSAWVTATECVDLHTGGWVRVHENVPLRAAPDSPADADDPLRRRGEEIRREFAQIFTTVRSGELGEDDAARLSEAVAISDITRVKSYSPGVYHCVFDIFLPGTGQPV